MGEEDEIFLGLEPYPDLLAVFRGDIEVLDLTVDGLDVLTLPLMTGLRVLSWPFGLFGCMVDTDKVRILIF